MIFQISQAKINPLTLTGDLAERPVEAAWFNDADKHWYVNVTDLVHLVALAKETGSPLIVDAPSELGRTKDPAIEVYNDYIE